MRPLNLSVQPASVTVAGVHEIHGIALSCGHADDVVVGIFRQLQPEGWTIPLSSAGSMTGHAGGGQNRLNVRNKGCRSRATAVCAARRNTVFRSLIHHLATIREGSRGHHSIHEAVHEGEGSIGNISHSICIGITCQRTIALSCSGVAGTCRRREATSTTNHVVANP